MVTPPTASGGSPQTIGRYRILKRLGVGGMAEVLLAEMPSEAGLAKRVVVKRILPHLRGDAELVRMLLDEARITLPLAQSNIAAALELGRDGEDYYLVSEHVDGTDLEAILKRAKGPLPVGVALAVIRDTLEALAYAHEFSDPHTGQPLNIVHRDVSPGNILLGRRGEVKLADFGVARAVHRMRSTIDGAVRGTLPHMSPEQATGTDVDGRSDIYSVGTLLWHMLSGQRVPGLTRGYGVAPLVKLEVDTDLDELMQRSMEVDPAARFQKAGEMLSRVRVLIAKHAGENDPRAAIASLVVEVVGHKGSQTPAPEPVDPDTPTVVLAADAGTSAGARETGGAVTATTSAMTANVSGAVAPAKKRLAPILLATAAAAVVFLTRPLWLPAGPASEGELRTDEPIAQAQPDVPSRIAATTIETPNFAEAEVAAGRTVKETQSRRSRATPHRFPGPKKAAGDESSAGSATAAVPNEEAEATLHLLATPWAYAEINGKRLPGNTPLRNLRVAPGEYKLRFVNPEMGRSKVVDLVIAAGAEKRISVNLDEL